jgi:hypothetical protein
VFENIVVRIFGSQRDQRQGWGKVHNEELRNLYSSQSIIRMGEMCRVCSTNWEKRNMYSLLVGKTEGKRPLGRPRRWWVANINMDLGEKGWGDMDWIGLAQDRDRWWTLVNTTINQSAVSYHPQI